MDAKPQRPLKTLRGGGDENVIKPELQKHKSTGALSAKMMAAGGGLRAAAKRTAFGDLSNTTKLGGAVQDDSAINVKDYNVKKVQVAAAPTLLRPPMRSVAPVNNSYNHSLPAAKQVQSNKVLAVPSKRTNAVFKDSDHELVISNAPAEYEASYNANSKGSNERRGDPEIDYELPVMNGRTVSVEEFYDITFGGMNEASEKAEEARKRSEQLREVEKKEEESNELYKEYMQLVHAGLTNDGEDFGQTRGVTGEHQQVGALNQGEGYDIEDDDDDDQDYTTAHSLRSMRLFPGPVNTTTDVTKVLFPKFTAKTRAELEIAAKHVASTMSKHEMEDEAWDTSMVAEYAEDIFSFMKELEMQYLPPANYMDHQVEIQWSMRAVLMDWMVQVHGRFGLTPETLFLCVNIIDRFLAVKVVSLGKLQLVGATALFIAAKYEEINCPSIAEIVFMVDGGYNGDEILKAERFMLMMVNFQLGAPGPLSFLRRISKADEYDQLTRTLAKYLMEVTIMDEQFVSTPASFIAASALCASRLVLNKPDWTLHHVHYSGYTYEQLREIVCQILQCCEHAQSHHKAVFEKFAEKRYKRVSIIVQTQMTTGVGVVVPGYEGGSIHAYGSAYTLPQALTQTYYNPL